MRGSTRKRGSTWTAYWDLPPDVETGERRQKTKGGFKRQKDCEAFLATVVTSVNDGAYVEPSKAPLAAYMATEWLPAVRGQLRPLTARKYAQIVRTHIKGRDIGAVPLRALNPGHVNALYGELEDAGLSAATRRLVHAVLRRALQDAVRWEKIKRNPATNATPPALPRSRAQAWTASELRRFLEHAEGDRLAALWRLAATTGMRRGELLGLTWQALDGGRLSVAQQLVPTRGGATFGPPKSRRSERTIALDTDTVEALDQHRAVQVLERDLAGPAYQDQDLVFCNELGQPIYPTRLGERFHERRKAAGIPTGSLHTLRHTSATLALTNGVPLHVVAARLGDDPKTVLGVYSHLLPNSDEMAAETLASVLVDKPLTEPAASPAVEPNIGL
jgi:integrase